ncbi:class I SAM-dependent methyltransferase [Crocinitomicaceae bacterium]|nr:class I SAM-dependent methyltransferase [Crocinitomicaceae bacterium]
MEVLPNDPIGQAIQDFVSNDFDEHIIVSSEICDDDIIPVEMLFRSYDQMPKIEQVALSLCKGKVLDIGAGAGIHANYLKNKNFEVDAIDISPGAVKYMQSKGISARHSNFYNESAGNYDTLLLLMNGIGIAGSLANLDTTLIHAKKLVTDHGKIICDSTDIKYLYEDETGGMWVDLSSEYYGDFHFQMHYKNHQTEGFDWLYVDFENLREAAERTGWKAEKRFADEDHYLAELTLL